MGVRVFGIDWSGAKSGVRRKIWLAEAVDSQLVRLEAGRNRDEIAEHLTAEAMLSREMIVGLDFAFSLPAWFLAHHRLCSVHQLWRHADRHAETWLASCQWPFWGRPGCPRPDDLPGHYRRTELDAPATAGVRPKSTFQVGGAGAVGTGSLRGMGILLLLHEAGFSIWPFDPPGWPRVIEIYPRLLTGAVNRSDASARAAYLANHYPALDAELRRRAASCEDAFDAGVSALVMAAHLDEIVALAPATDPQLSLEGLIWYASSQPRPAVRRA